MTFRAPLLLHGKSATGISVPPEVVETLGGGKRPPVKVSLNGYSYRSTIASMGGEHLIPVSGEHRKAANIQAGDEISVSLSLDLEPREVAIPEDFAVALSNSEVAKARFEKMSYSHQKRHVTLIEGAKSVETRQRRIDKAIEMLLSD